MPKVGHKISAEARQKMREAKLRNPVRYWKGKKISPEHNAKLQAGKLLKAPKPRLGAHLSLESRAQISRKLKAKFASGELVSPLKKLGIIGRRGPGAPNWQGGRSKEGQRLRGAVEYREWRQTVFKRDNYTCRFCKRRGGRLEADHVKSFSKHPRLRLEVANGRTLCHDCHQRLTYYPKKKESDLRVSFIDKLISLAETDPSIILVVSDVGFKHADRFKEKFPDRYFNFGVTELTTTMITTAMGLSGLKVFQYSMINFVLYRPFEAVRNGIDFHKSCVALVGVSGSEAYRFLGRSHNGIGENEDVNLIDHLPETRIYLPRNDNEVKNDIEKIYLANKPCYIRL